MKNSQALIKKPRPLGGAFFLKNTRTENATSPGDKIIAGLPDLTINKPTHGFVQLKNPKYCSYCYNYALGLGEDRTPRSQQEN